MLAQVHSFVLEGIEPAAVEVEVDVSEHGMAKTAVAVVSRFVILCCEWNERLAP